MVMDKMGTPSFFVSRRLAESPLRADLRARWSGMSGNSRFIVLLGSFDCSVRESKMRSIPRDLWKHKVALVSLCLVISEPKGTRPGPQEQDLRPDLRPGIWDDGKSHVVVVESDPRNLLEGGQGGHQLWTWELVFGLDQERIWNAYSRRCGCS